MLLILVGKSGSGKDYTMRKLVEKGYIQLVSWTTRPMREGEVEGREYHFCNNDEFSYMIDKGLFVEWRRYETLMRGESDVWYYGTMKEKLDNNKNYVIILDLEGARKVKEWYNGECKVVYLNVNNRIRKERAIKRGGFDEKEWSRRLERDEIDFAEEKRDIVDIECEVFDVDGLEFM